MLEKITKIFREYKDDEALVINEGTTFEELSLDSLDTVELIMSVEEEFGVNIDLKTTPVKTIGDLMNVIKEQNA